MNDKLTLAEKEYVILQSYNGEADRIRLNRDAEREILIRIRELDQQRNGIIGEAKKIDTELKNNIEDNILLIILV